ncbi:MAG: hypothetical protein ACXU8A_14320 [Burkholderiaceae bacterium]
MSSPEDIVISIPVEHADDARVSLVNLNTTYSSANSIPHFR